MSTQLTYRGTTYQSVAHPIETTPTQQLAQYRGLHYTVRCPMNVPQSESKVLKYRGIPYNTGNVTMPPSQPSPTTTTIIPAFN